MSSKRDYYEILGVARTSAEKEIKQAYRKVALKYHPDRNPGDNDAESIFKEAAEAYEVLSDAKKRKVYDQYGHDGLRGKVHEYSSFDDVFSNFGSIFEEFFGRGFGGAGGGGRRAMRGEDLRLDLSLTLEETATGIEKAVEAERLRECSTCAGTGAKPGVSPEVCSTCRGHGQVARAQGFFSIATTCPTCRGEGRIIREHCGECSGEARVAVRSKLTVSIPAGVDNGARLRMMGEGEGGLQGGPAGDLYIYLSVAPHDTFSREENNLILDQPISITQAALGTTLELPTLDGHARVKVAAGTQTGDETTLRGKGFPNLRRGFGKGAQIVRFRVEVPRKLSRRQRDLLKELSETIDAPK